MDSYDFHIAQQTKQNRNAHIAVAVFFFVLFLLVVVLFLAKCILDRNERRKSNFPSEKNL